MRQTNDETAPFLGPDYMIIGAMKCGTSTLAAQLGAQEGVFMTTPKEPNFFSDDAVYQNGLTWYQDLFTSVEANDIIGEASTHYTKAPTYPLTLTRIQQAGFHPRFIYVIRNPIARAISHYIHEWTEARMGGDVSAEFAAHPEIVDYGRYAFQIRPYIEAFGAERIHLTSLEQIKADPYEEFNKIGAFLDLPATSAWNDTLAPQNVSAERMRQIPLQGLLIDNPLAKALRQWLVPKPVRTLIRQKRMMKTRPELPDNIRTELVARFLEDRAALAGLFPGHQALDLCYPFAGK